MTAFQDRAVIALKLAAVCAAALIVQLTLFVELRLFGVVPELLALVAVLSGYCLDTERGPLLAFCAGLLWDVYLPTPLGVSAIVFAVVAFSVAALEEGMFHDTRRQILGLAAAGSAACVLGYALLAALLGHGGIVDAELLRVAGIVAVLNAIIAPLLMPLMRWALAAQSPRGGLRRPAERYG